MGAVRTLRDRSLSLSIFPNFEIRGAMGTSDKYKSGILGGPQANQRDTLQADFCQVAVGQQKWSERLSSVRGLGIETISSSNGCPPLYKQTRSTWRNHARTSEARRRGVMSNAMLTMCTCGKHLGYTGDALPSLLPAGGHSCSRCNLRLVFVLHLYTRSTCAPMIDYAKSRAG